MEKGDIIKLKVKGVIGTYTIKKVYFPRFYTVELGDMYQFHKDDILGYFKIEEFQEGDDCPKCESGMLVVKGPHPDDGICYLKCQDCNFDATEEEKYVLIEDGSR